MLKCFIFDVIVFANTWTYHATDVGKQVSLKNSIGAMLNTKFMGVRVLQYLLLLPIFHIVEQLRQLVFLRAWLDIIDLMFEVLVIVASAFRVRTRMPVRFQKVGWAQGAVTRKLL